MSKILFVPLRILGGTLVGVIAKQMFKRLWSAFDEEQAPDPKHEQIDWKKLALALVLQGAILRAVRGLFDHGSRRLFSKLTGSWPGEQRPDPA